MWITGQLAAAAGVGVDDFVSPLDFEADDDDDSLEDSVEVLDFVFSPLDEVLPVLALLSVR